MKIKIRNLTLILMISSILNAMGMDPKKTIVMIKNNYKDPIVININGQDAAIIQPSKEDQLYIWPQQMKIRAYKAGSISHSGIEKEVRKVFDAAQRDPIVEATITITGDLFNFYYSTNIKQAPAIPTTPAPQVTIKTIIEHVRHSQDITPLINFIFSHQREFTGNAARIPIKLNLIMRAKYSGSDEKNAPMPFLSRDILYKINHEFLQTKSMTPQQYIDSIALTIDNVFSFMIVNGWRKGIVTFPGMNITNEYLEQVRNWG